MCMYNKCICVDTYIYIYTHITVISTIIKRTIAAPAIQDSLTPASSIGTCTFIYIYIYIYIYKYNIEREIVYIYIYIYVCCCCYVVMVIC